ncbi:MAG TPA: M48 family metallopeptidase [Flavobacteriaceae bacterium]
MEYVGLQTQIWRNNSKSVMLLLAFPMLLFVLVWLFFYIIYYKEATVYGYEAVNSNFLSSIPFVIIGVGIWFLIAWFSHSSMIQKATASRPLERKENLRVYNLVENLCMSRGMAMPKVYVINDDSLNAFASGINEKTYTVTLSQGIINKLDDAELEGVIAHELTHIINRDVRLLIVSIIFVGIFAFISEMAFRTVLHVRIGGRDKKGGAIAIILVVILLGLLGYLFSSLFRLSLSRKREFMADAGASQLTKNPKALASALRKISNDPWIEAVERDDVAQLFIEHPTKKKKGIASFFNTLFATHPPIDKRISVLEQF